jgi:hypothetical protein
VGKRAFQLKLIIDTEVRRLSVAVDRGDLQVTLVVGGVRFFRLFLPFIFYKTRLAVKP